MTPSTFDPANATEKGLSLGRKLIAIALICLAMFIPQILIKQIVYERQSTRQSAAHEVYQKWSTQQQISGPMIKVPNKLLKGDPIYILPETLMINGGVVSQQLSRGIYDFTVYESTIELTGEFVLPKELDGATIGAVDFDRSQMVVAISDLRGVTDNVDFMLDGISHETTSCNELGGGGLTCRVNTKPLFDGGKIAFSITLPINGSERLSFIPVGRTTEATLTSDCTTPSFDGAFLPTDRHVADSGFTASWKVLAINRDFSQVAKSNISFMMGNGDFGSDGGSNFGVSLMVPASQYQQTERAIKYAMLIVLLTFAVVFFVEIRKSTPIHPVQYLLVGAALMLFYTLLLSFSEQCSFLVSYIIASVMTIGLIVAYLVAILKIKKTAFAIGGLLTLTYLFVYILLQLENYALMVGSIGLFVILAVAMYASQKIDWYRSKNADK